MTEHNLNLKTEVVSRENRRITKESPGKVEQVEAHSLAQHFPVEVLSEIFIRGIPTYVLPFLLVATPDQWRAFFSDVFPMNLTRISRSWRYAALNTRCLWSTWFIEIQSPSTMALSMLNLFLKRFISRSGTLTLKPHIRLNGSFDSVQACASVAPILECQERWEDVDICFGEAEGDSRSVLDFAKLSTLQGLTLQGSLWECHGGDPGIFDTLPIAENTPKLSSLRSAKLFHLLPPTYFSILSAAPNLTDLTIYIRDDIDNLANVRCAVLPCLRRLALQRSSLQPNVTMAHVSLLELLKFQVLEELSINSLSLPHPLAMFVVFLHENGPGDTLTSLRLFNGPGPHDPSLVDQLYGSNAFVLHHLLPKLRSLRFLEVYGEPNPMLLSFLTHTVDDDANLRICPLLEEVILEGASGREFQFTELVTARWNAPRRCIRAITFLNCEVTSVLSVNHPRSLLGIPGVDTCLQEGLELYFRNDVVI